METSKKSILIVHNFYKIGGGEHAVFENEVKLLKEHGHKVVTYTRDNRELDNSLLKKILLPITCVWSYKTYIDIKKTIKKENIDIIHCHNTFPLISPSVYYAARKMKKPIIQTIHNFRFLCPAGIFYREGKICEKCLEKNNFKSAIKNKCYRNSKIQTLIMTNMLRVHRMLGTYKRINYIFLTEFNKSKFKKLLDLDASNIFIKPNFVDSKKISPIKNNKNKNKNKNKFIYMGRLEDNKGIKELITFWNKLESKYELHIYGDGTLDKYVIEESRKNNKIKFLGFKSQEEIFGDLNSSYGLIFPSTCYEGFPMTITECMALGKPILSTNIGNQNSIMEESKGGVTYQSNSFESFKNSLDNLIKNYDEYSENAREYYEKKLSEEKNYKELLNIYEKAKYIK